MKFLQHVVEALAGIHKEFETNLSSAFGEVKVLTKVWLLCTLSYEAIQEVK